MAVLPLGRAANVGAVALVVARDQHAGHHRADGDAGVEFSAIWNAFLLRHPPMRAFVVALGGVEPITPERGLHRLPILGQAIDADRPTVAARRLALIVI